MTRFKKDKAAQQALANTAKLSSVKSEDFAAVFYPGGHGPMWDLAEDPVTVALLESFTIPASQSRWFATRLVFCVM